MSPAAVYYVRPGRNEELRYSLRSLHENFPHSAVFIVGDPPEWVDEDAVTVRRMAPRKRSKQQNVLELWQEITGLVGGPFTLWNDDFFLLRPTEPVLYDRGPVAETIRRKRPARSDYLGPYYTRMKRTADYLTESHGIENPLGFELHVPLLVERPEVFAEAVEITKRHDSGSGANNFQPRTIYGNLCGLPSETISDVKTDDARKNDLPWSSGNEQNFQRGAYGREVRRLFRAPSPYEKAST
jgi:hypothetical protein